MYLPNCLQPLTGLSCSIWDGSKRAPVSLAGYRLKPEKQYFLRIYPLQPSIEITSVTIENDEHVEQYASIRRNDYFEVRFVVKSVGPAIPFRVITGMLKLQADVITTNGSQVVELPIVLANFSLSLFSGAGGIISAMGFVLTFILQWSGYRLSPQWQTWFLVGLILFVGPILSLSYHHFILKQRVRELRAHLEDEDEDDL